MLHLQSLRSVRSPGLFFPHASSLQQLLQKCLVDDADSIPALLRGIALQLLEEQTLVPTAPRQACRADSVTTTSATTCTHGAVGLAGRAPRLTQSCCGHNNTTCPRHNPDTFHSSVKIVL